MFQRYVSSGSDRYLKGSLWSCQRLVLARNFSILRNGSLQRHLPVGPLDHHDACALRLRSDQHLGHAMSCFVVLCHVCYVLCYIIPCLNAWVLTLYRRAQRAPMICFALWEALYKCHITFTILLYCFSCTMLFDVIYHVFLFDIHLQKYGNNTTLHCLG